MKTEGIKVPYNKIYQMQDKNLIPSVFKKAVISSINLQNRSVNIYIVGSSQTIINNVPLAKSVDITTIQQGQRCRVDFFDESNPRDMVIAYVY